MFFMLNVNIVILVAAHGATLGYANYTAAESDASRKLHHIKTHQQVSNTGQIDNTRPIEEMPYQVNSISFKL